MSKGTSASNGRNIVKFNEGGQGTPIDRTKLSALAYRCNRNFPNHASLLQKLHEAVQGQNDF